MPPPQIPHSRTLIVPHTVCGATCHANRKKGSGSYCIREPVSKTHLGLSLSSSSIWFPAQEFPIILPAHTDPATKEHVCMCWATSTCLHWHLVTLSPWREKDASRIWRQEHKGLKKNLPEVLLLSIIQGEQITSDLNISYFLWKKKK